MFDRLSLIEMDTLVRNCKFVAEVLCRHVYDLNQSTDMSIVKGAYDIDKQFVVSWMEYISSIPRMGSYINHKHELLKKVQDTLKTYTVEVTKTLFKIDSRFEKYYTSDVASVSAYRVKPFTFDIYFMCSVCGYLMVLTLALQPSIVSTLISDIREALCGSGKKSKHK